MEVAQLIAGLAFIAAALTRLELNILKRADILFEEDKLVEAGPPPDGIPSIDRPVFVNIQEAREWLSDRDPVIVLKLKDEARAYPLQLMIWHEIVNDYFEDEPVVITFSAISNSTVAFRRQVRDRSVEFGISGKLYYGATVMYDRQTGSHWLHYTGECIKGRYAGNKLKAIPLLLISFRDFIESFPGGKVLSRNTGFGRNYGRSPYIGYGRADQPPLFYKGEIDDRLLPKERVLGIRKKGEALVYPYSVLRQQGKRGVIQENCLEGPVVVFYSRGTNSVVDTASIRFSRDAGSAAAFSPLVRGEELIFDPREEGFKDKNTGSLWSMAGRCLEGFYENEELKSLEHMNSFWFAWALHYPHTKIYKEI